MPINPGTTRNQAGTNALAARCNAVAALTQQDTHSTTQHQRARAIRAAFDESGQILRFSFGESGFIFLNAIHTKQEMVTCTFVFYYYFL
jgi:hypothetical protein